jgi:chitin synthase
VKGLTKANSVVHRNRLINPETDETNETKKRKLTSWQIFSRILTVLIPDFVLKWFGKKDSNMRQAFREKLALCFIILIIFGVVGFLSIFLTPLLCPTSLSLAPKASFSQFGASPNSVSIYGRIFNIVDLGSIRNVPKDVRPGADLSFTVRRDLSVCSDITSGNNTFQYPCGANCVNDYDLNYDGKQYLYFEWKDIRKSEFLVYNGVVMFLADYFKNPFLSKDVTAVLKNHVGKDATLAILQMPNGKANAECIKRIFEVGMIDDKTPGCLASSVFLYLSIAVILGLVLVKFIMAVAFNWFMVRKLRRNGQSPYVVLLVTCYSEGMESLKATLDSLCVTDYQDKHKLLFVVADGIVTGHGESQSTPDILLDMMQVKDRNVLPMSYIAVGDKKHNKAKVYSGFYFCQGRKVPMVVVVKCGTEAESKAPKPGNRGKRDSQLILMQFFQRLYCNDRMTELDYDLFSKIRDVTRVNPDAFEIALMVDADTRVLSDSLSHMVAAMVSDAKVMGLCGETRIYNSTQNWITWIQVFEYYINHHLGKAFER